MLFRSVLKINCASKEDLMASNLFTMQEIDSIINYKNNYGPFLSIEEMQALNEFTVEQLKELKSHLDFELPTRYSDILSLHKINGQISSRILLPANFKSSEHTNYVGSDYQTAFGVRLNIGNHLSLSYNGKKDAGEQFQFSKGVNG